MRAIAEALCTLRGKHQDKNKEREGAGRTTGGGRALLFVLRKTEAISTARANGGELDLADAQEDTGVEDANPGKEHVPPRALLNALEGQPLDLKETSSTIERQRR